MLRNTFFLVASIVPKARQAELAAPACLSPASRLYLAHISPVLRVSQVRQAELAAIRHRLAVEGQRKLFLEAAEAQRKRNG